MESTERLLSGEISDPRTAVRYLSWIYLVGATLGLISMLLPQPQGTDRNAIYLLLGIAYGVLVLISLFGTRRPQLAIQFGMAAGTVLITLGIYATGQPTSVYGLFYVWIGLDAFYLLRRSHAVAQISFVAVAYGAVLLARPAADGFERWLITASTVLVAGLLVGVMRSRLERLVRGLSRMVERLGEVANTDTLTELLNRRGWNELLDRELERSRRAGGSFALLLCDLDGFKGFNERLGHERGDRALREVAELLRVGVRKIDTVSRLDAEEFAVFLPDTSEVGAQSVAEGLRRALQDKFGSGADALTSSWGVATFPAQSDAEELMRAVDTALFTAKQLGRNRTVVFRPHLIDVMRPARTDSEENSQLTTMVVLAEVLDLRDAGTARHCQQVGEYCELMARELGYEPQRTARVRLAGILHDVGKIGVSDAVLRKPGPLTMEEWEQMREHPDTGAKLLGSNAQDIRAWVHAHHERPDGRGYPRGLRLDEIPIEARILAIADAYEAMTADRVYRPAMSHQAAQRELRANAGSQFDSDLVELFISAMRRRLEGVGAQV